MPTIPMILKRKKKIEVKSPNIPPFSNFVLYFMKANIMKPSNPLMLNNKIGNIIPDFGGFIINIQIQMSDKPTEVKREYKILLLFNESIFNDFPNLLLCCPKFGDIIKCIANFLRNNTMTLFCPEI